MIALSPVIMDMTIRNNNKQQQRNKMNLYRGK